MRYPEDFKPFSGKILNEGEINLLIEDAQESEAGTVSTGNILVERNEDESLNVYQLIATSK